MTTFLYGITRIIAKIHSYILSLNDTFEYNFSDKYLHFLVIGALGILLVFILHPIFTWLAKRDHILVITWMYVFTVIVVITFAIEIGQRISGTGQMEFGDIVFGVLGFLFMFSVFAVIRGLVKLVIKLIKNKRA